MELKIKDMMDIIENNQNIMSFLDEAAENKTTNDGELNDSLVLNQDSESVLKMKSSPTMQQKQLRTKNKTSFTHKIHHKKSNSRPTQSASTSRRKPTLNQIHINSNVLMSMAQSQLQSMYRTQCLQSSFNSS